MKKAIISFTIIVFLLLSLLMVGCGSSKNNTVIDMMKRMPDDTTEFYVQDFKKGRAIRAEEICEAYGRYLDLGEETILEWGIDLDEADIMAMFISDVSVLIFGGDFTLDSIREKLAKSGLHQEEYRGVEIWKERDNNGESGFAGPLIHALISNRLILVGMEHGIDGCLDVMEQGDASLYENEDFMDIIERLPGGLTVSCSIHWEPEVGGIIVGGFSLPMNKDGTQDFTWVGKFESSEAAINGSDMMLSDLADVFNFDMAIAQAIQDGIYLTITAESQEIY
jgi:hypothetical protein